MTGETESAFGFSIKSSVVLRLSWLPMKGEWAPIEVEGKKGNYIPEQKCVVKPVREVSSQIKFVTSPLCLISVGPTGTLTSPSPPLFIFFKTLST